MAAKKSRSSKMVIEGWCTVVTIADDGQTVLLLDLREVPRVPAWLKKDRLSTALHQRAEQRFSMRTAPSLGSFAHSRSKCTPPKSPTMKQVSKEYLH
jgi:hypothetical protein